MSRTPRELIKDYLYISNAIAYAEEAILMLGTIKGNSSIEAIAIQRGIELTVGTTCEYINKLSDDTKRQNQNFPWNEVSGTRNMLFHDYSNVDETRIIDTVLNDFPKLVEDLKKLQAEAAMTILDKGQELTKEALAQKIKGKHHRLLTASSEKENVTTHGLASNMPITLIKSL
ncbi:MAG: DUF86 domain-containing protein [Coriobacteriales bacterium]|jgi:uncharacterized protein with HEPN domain|nr:DUF86 domain-containing protein [Coriobacteriales bacterium]